MIRLLIEHPTKASNTREHVGARMTRVRKEREAVAVKFRSLLANGHPGLLVPGVVVRKPLGLTREQLDLAKKFDVDLRVMESIARPVGPLVVRLTRISSGALDEDNLRSALKAMRDQVARELGIDDRDPIVKWDYDSPGQERGPKKYQAVRIEIELRAGSVTQPQQGELLRGA